MMLKNQIQGKNFMVGYKENIEEIPIPAEYFA